MIGRIEDHLMTPHRSPSTTATALIAILLATAAGCSTTDSAEVAPVEPSATTVAATVTSTSPPATTAAPTVPETTAAPTTTEARPKRKTIDGGGPFEAGPYRATRTFGPRFGINFELPVDGLYGIDVPGLLSIDSVADGSEVLVTVHHLDAALTLEPTLDTTQIGAFDYMLSMSSETPDDLLAWLTSRPGVTATGSAEEVELGGRPARRQTFEFGPFDGAQACSLGDDRACHFLLFHPVSGYSIYHQVGDVATVYELTVGPNRVAVVVDANIEPELAATVAESLEFLDF